MDSAEFGKPSVASATTISDAARTRLSTACRKRRRSRYQRQVAVGDILQFCIGSCTPLIRTREVALSAMTAPRTRWPRDCIRQTRTLAADFRLGDFAGRRRPVRSSLKPHDALARRMSIVVNVNVTASAALAFQGRLGDDLTVGLFRRRRRRNRPRTELPVILLSCNGDYQLEVRGESYREDAIRRLVDVSGAEQLASDRCRCELEVCLRREPTNPVDPNAVQVLSCSGELLGYIARERAPDYSRVLRSVETRALIHCRACAYGRLINGRRWNFGIWLGVPDADELGKALDGLSKDSLSPL